MEQEKLSSPGFPKTTRLKDGRLFDNFTSGTSVEALRTVAQLSCLGGHVCL